MNISRRNLIQMALLATGALAVPAIANTDTIDTLPKAYAISGGTASGKTRQLELIAREWLGQDPLHNLVILDFEGSLIRKMQVPVREYSLIGRVLYCPNPDLILSKPSSRFLKRLSDWNYSQENTLVLMDMPQIAHTDTREGATRHLCKTFAQQTGLNVIYTVQNPGKGRSITMKDGKVVDNPYSGTTIARLIRSAEM